MMTMIFFILMIMWILMLILLVVLLTTPLLISRSSTSLFIVRLYRLRYYISMFISILLIIIVIISLFTVIYNTPINILFNWNILLRISIQWSIITIWFIAEFTFIDYSGIFWFIEFYLIVFSFKFVDVRL